MATAVNPSSSPSCPKPKAAKPARYCLCTPTTHPGSFRCRLHRAKAAAPSSVPEAAKESASAASAAKKEAAAAAPALLARVGVAWALRLDVGRIKGFQLRPSRLRIMDR